MRGRLGSSLTTIAVLVLVGVLCATHAGDVGDALAAIPPSIVATAVALHLGTLVLRTEAWRLVLVSAGGDRLTRSAVHGANAVAFAAGAVQSQAALPARVAVLRRLAGETAPRAAQIWAADVPIFGLELFATALMLTAAVVSGRGAWWIAAAGIALAVGVLLAARFAPIWFAGRPVLRGLAVLADPRRRGALVVLVAGMSTLTAVRLWLVLSVCGLPHGLGEVAWVFAALGIFGLLPLGPGAPSGATLAALGATHVGAAVAAGLMLGASSIIAVAAYAALVPCAARLPGRLRLR